jgi:phosphomevalonate kinase
MRVSVPGNLLVLGEYAVLEEGGLGAAAAIEKRVRLQAEPAEGLSVEGVWPGGSFRWTPQGESGSPIVTAVFATVNEWMKRQGRGREIPGLRVRIDSSELYSKRGRKMGFGSSAAVAVALVAALGVDKSRLDATVPRLALTAHRSAQEGMGSGYDVYCSFHGGWGLFRGGAGPSWKPHEAGIDAQLHLFPGPTEVSTVTAIRAFLQWKDQENNLARRLIEESNGNAWAFLTAGSVEQAAAAFKKGRKTGIALGDAIGVEARIPAPVGVDPELCKSLGAGNELGAYLQLPGAPAPPPESGLTLIRIDPYGIIWQP